MEKASFKIFYSWMSDRPAHQNIKYIRKVLQKDCEALEKELKIKIEIDSDSRGTNGEDTIDTAILKKIAACDLFVCDTTPVRNFFITINKTQEKLIPNPNAVFELGYAVSSLGWSRCILVWNEKYGDVGEAPFDIRNHLTIPYHINKHPLSFYAVIKDKFKKYDEIVKEWRTSKERSFDSCKYVSIKDVFAERDLLDSIKHFLTNRVYSMYTFKKWEELIYTYRNYPDTHFVDKDLHQSYLEFIDALEKLDVYASTYNEPHHMNKDISEDQDPEEWERKYMYIIRDPFYYIPDPEDALNIQKRMEKEISIIEDAISQSYKKFRDLVRVKLLI